MPQRDGNGPEGRGALTGGARGFCSTNSNQELFQSRISFKNRFGSRTERIGGAGYGWHNQSSRTGFPGWQPGYNQPGQSYGTELSVEQELLVLDSQLNFHNDALKRIEI